MTPLTILNRILNGLVVGGLFLSLVAFSATSLAPASPYTYKRPSFDGTGKVYMGREIAQVMGYQGSQWLERKDRAQEEQPQTLVEALALNPTDAIADIGAGTGYISFKIAAKVPQGRVLAVDVQPEMIQMLGDRISQSGQTNVTPILGTERDPKLSPNSIDLAIFVDAYHELAYPREVMTAVAQSLKPEGRIALVEYRAEDPFVFIKPLHKMTQAQVRQEMAAVGLQWQETKSVLPQQHLMLFARPQPGTVTGK
ncbi:class I SAM-dependent methyltransferase [Altericista sp. CCNU0014]|uniref:class I SAM-dependent methyltransferase n=1 Tax=Altericista sp. CCNU0014 TaxID=3082949 RepID=UPI0038509788